MLPIRYPQLRANLFVWESTFYAYGDLWRILGVTANRMGFAINDAGLYLRIKEVETTHPKASPLCLTSELKEVMDFLRLDHNRFIAGFTTLNEVFEWETSSRFFLRRCFEKQRSLA